MEKEVTVDTEKFCKLTLNNESIYAEGSGPNEEDNWSVNLKDLGDLGNLPYVKYEEQSLEDDQKKQVKINLELPYSYTESSKQETEIISTSAQMPSVEDTVTISGTFDVSSFAIDKKINVAVEYDGAREISQNGQVTGEDNGVWTVTLYGFDGYEHGVWDDGSEVKISSSEISFVYKAIANNDFAGQTCDVKVYEYESHEETHYENPLPIQLVQDAVGTQIVNNIYGVTTFIGDGLLPKLTVASENINAQGSAKFLYYDAANGSSSSNGELQIQVCGSNGTANVAVNIEEGDTSSNQGATIRITSNTNDAEIICGSTSFKMSELGALITYAKGQGWIN